MIQGASLCCPRLGSGGALRTGFLTGDRLSWILRVMRNAEFILCTSCPKAAQTQNFRTKGTRSILISQKRNLRLRSTDVLQVIQWHNARSGWSWDIKHDLNAANHAFSLDSALALGNIMPGIACFFMIFFSLYHPPTWCTAPISSLPIPISSSYMAIGWKWQD